MLCKHLEAEDAIQAINLSTRKYFAHAQLLNP